MYAGRTTVLKKIALFAALVLLCALSAPALGADAVDTDSLRKRYPGWTLRSARQEEAGVTTVWTRLVNGLMYAKQEMFSDAQSSLTEWMPVPVTEDFAESLRAGEMERLFAVDGERLVFLMPSGLDMDRLSCPGAAVSAVLYPQQLQLVTDEGRLCVSARNEYGYFLSRKTPVLPEGVHLDLTECSDTMLSLSFDDGREAVFLRTPEGEWHLKLVHFEGKALYQVESWGILDLSTVISQSSEGIVFGAFEWLDLFNADLKTLPGTCEEASYLVNRSGWAVVGNPKATESLNLRAMPDETSRSLGRFYNRTPVEVLTWQGNWSLVRVGGDLEGWMQTKYLFFGRQMDGVHCAFPMFPEDMEQSFLQSRNRLGEDLIGVPVFWYVGVQGDYALIMNSSRELYSIPRKAVD